MSDVAKLVQMIGAGKGAKFVSFDYTAKETGEVSRIVVILGAKTENLYLRDVRKLQRMLKALLVKGNKILIQAAAEILQSRLTSLEKGIGHNPAYTCADAYIHPIGLPNGISVHKETGEIYVCGLVEMKTVLVPGIYKNVNSRPLTIAKRKIEKRLPSGRFRRYILRNISKASMNGETLVIDTEPVVTAQAA